MAYIKTISHDESSGLLRRLYDEAVARAGKIWNVVRLMSIRPETLRSSMMFYRTLMFGESELSRAQREMIATVVSRTNGCHY